MTHEEFKQKFDRTTAEYALGAMVGEDSIMMIALHKENKDDDSVSCNVCLAGDPVKISHALYTIMQNDPKTKAVIMGAAALEAIKSKM